MREQAGLNRCGACGAPLYARRCTTCGHEPQVIEGFDCHAPELAHGGGGYDAAHYSTLAALEDGNFWFRARNKLILSALRRHAPRLRHFLEIGCGTGYVLRGVQQAFPQADLTGSEVFVEGLHHASQRLPGVALVQMDARAIPSESGFDAIGAFDVVEHIEEDTRVLLQMYRALAPGGTLILTVPQHRWLWSEQDDVAHHVRRYTRRELLDKVRAAGFEVAQATSFVTLLLPLMMVSRLRRDPATATVDPFRELRIPRWMNTMLSAAMQVDLLAIRMGLSLPVGGSLLVVARKAAT